MCYKMGVLRDSLPGDTSDLPSLPTQESGRLGKRGWGGALVHQAAFVDYTYMDMALSPRSDRCWQLHAKPHLPKSPSRVVPMCQPHDGIARFRRAISSHKRAPL